MSTVTEAAPSRPARRSRGLSHHQREVGGWSLAILVICVASLVPVLWIVFLSLKTPATATDGSFIPHQWTLSNYNDIFKAGIFTDALRNSIGIGLIATVIAVLAGYALVHIRPRGAGIVLAMLLVSLYFPVRVVSLISIYETQHSLGLINNTAGLILPSVKLQLVISILIIRSMFELVPHELIEAARIDGAGHLRTLWEVGLPMVRSGLVVIFIVNFVAAWGEYLLGVTLIDDEAKRTMPVVLAAAQGGQGQWAWPNLAAVYVIVVTPGILAFTFAQKLFFKGLLEGALKG